LISYKEWLAAGMQRICRDLWIAMRDPKLLTLTASSCTIRRGELHHGRLLVHCIDVVCQSCRYSRAFVLRHIRWNQTCRCSMVHPGSVCRCTSRYFLIWLVGSKSTKGHTLSLLPFIDLPVSSHVPLSRA